MNHHPVHNRPDVVLYSAADYAPIPLDSKVIAHSLSRAACKTLDFPRLVNRVYEDGARIFVELGPRSTCTRWISDTLGSREHLSVSINQLGMRRPDRPAAYVGPLGQSRGACGSFGALHCQNTRPVSAVPWLRPTQANHPGAPGPF